MNKELCIDKVERCGYIFVNVAGLHNCERSGGGGHYLNASQSLSGYWKVDALSCRSEVPSEDCPGEYIVVSKSRVNNPEKLEAMETYVLRLFWHNKVPAI